MSLGIKRELFGDIVEKDKGFYLAVSLTLSIAGAETPANLE